MANNTINTTPFNIVVIGQNGRLMYEALIFAASLRSSDPDFQGQLFIAEPQYNDRWENNPTIRNDEVRTLLTNEYGAKILPFENRHFGKDYPNGNKIEALFALPKGETVCVF